MTSETQLLWRRNKTLELSSKGYSQVEIATQLQVNETTVSRDMAYLRQQAQMDLQRHIHETVPEEYQKGMVGLRQNLKNVLEIAENSPDPRIKLEARRIANDCYRYIMDLCTNGVIVSDALRFIQSKMDNLNVNNQEKSRSGVNMSPNGDNKEVEETTTNGVF
jgi:predicted transcriptional regulator